MHQPEHKPSRSEENTLRDLVIECHSSVHVGAFLLVVAGGLHHVLRVAEQRQVHQLVVQTRLLLAHHTHPEEKTKGQRRPWKDKRRNSECMAVGIWGIHSDLSIRAGSAGSFTLQSRMALL